MGAVRPLSSRLAQQIAKLKPENTLRLAWWGGEESRPGRVDSVREQQVQAERDRIALYMNYDMIGSPSYIFMVYDAAQSSFQRPARGADPRRVDG